MNKKASIVLSVYKPNKEYLEKHGYSVILTKKTFIEESWSRKNKYFYSGYEMVISWEGEE